MSQLVAVEKSSAAVAIALAKLENKMASEFKYDKALYTLVYGPEEETETDDGKVRRVSRVAIIRGIYRAAFPVLEQMSMTEKTQVHFRKPPPGAVSLD
jgi:hypothetical protein